MRRYMHEAEDLRNIVRPLVDSNSTHFEGAYYSGFFSPARKVCDCAYGVLTPGRALAAIYRNGHERQRGLTCFAADPNIKSTPPGTHYEGLPSDYQGGHLWPARYAFWDKTGAALSETNYTRNLAPQKRFLNIGPWLRAEDAAFDACASGRTLAICSGTLFNDVENPRQTPKGEAIPDWFWKVVAEPSTSKLACYLMPNEDYPDSTLEAHYVSFAALKHRTGLCFPGLVGYQDAPGLLDRRRDVSLPSEDILCEQTGEAEWTLLRPLLYKIKTAKGEASIIIPRGFTFDYASVPGWAQWIVPRQSEETDKAACLHDWLYATEWPVWLKQAGIYYTSSPSEARELCDWLFLEAMQQGGTGWLKRNTMYLCVRIGGGSVWKAHTPESIAAARCLIGTVEVPA